MTKDEVIAYMFKHEGEKEFYIQEVDNMEWKFRLYYDNPTNEVIMCGIGKSKSGKVLTEEDFSKWKSMKAVVRNDKYKKFRKFLTNVVARLKSSGLWESMKNDFEVILALQESEFKAYVDMDSLEKKEYDKKIGIRTWVNNLSVSASKGIKTINYTKGENGYGRNNKDRMLVKEHILNKTDKSMCWKNGYDNTLSVQNDGGEMKGWYSEEYKRCGNGHYYLMIDSSGAIYCETD